jgi:uncharacterized protein (DUF1697 family)
MRHGGSGICISIDREKRLQTYAALLHSIILSEGRRVLMSDLRQIALDAGFQHARTISATGNLAVEYDTALAVSEVEQRLESGILRRYGKHIDVIARTAPEWQRMANGNPFPYGSGLDGSLVIVRVMRQPLAADMEDRLNAYRTDGEKVAIVDGDLWLSFAGSPGKSRLLPQLTAKKLGAGTLRNWNTVRDVSGLLNK